ASAKLASPMAAEAELVRKRPRKPNIVTTAAPTAGPMAQASDQLARRTPIARPAVWGLASANRLLTSAIDWEKTAAPSATGTTAMTSSAAKLVVTATRA